MSQECQVSWVRIPPKVPSAQHTHGPLGPETARTTGAVSSSGPPPPTAASSASKRVPPNPPRGPGGQHEPDPVRSVPKTDRRCFCGYRPVCNRGVTEPTPLTAERVFKTHPNSRTRTRCPSAVIAAELRRNRQARGTRQCADRRTRPPASAGPHTVRRGTSLLTAIWSPTVLPSDQLTAHAHLECHPVPKPQQPQTISLPDWGLRPSVAYPSRFHQSRPPINSRTSKPSRSSFSAVLVEALQPIPSQ